MGTVKSTGVNADDVKSADVKSGTPCPPAEPRPRVDEISSLTDTYFNKTRAIVG